jgi:hypothetical protein
MATPSLDAWIDARIDDCMSSLRRHARMFARGDMTADNRKYWDAEALRRLAAAFAEVDAARAALETARAA